MQFERGASTHHHPIYQSQRWRDLRDEYIRRNGLVCRDREHDDRKPRAQPSSMLELDHVVAIRDNPKLAFDPGNVVLRCRACHRRKTVQEIKDRRQREEAQRYVERKRSD
jgi:5-methylcytosine-specific restriction endonuclease McrA